MRPRSRQRERDREALLVRDQPTSRRLRRDDGRGICAPIAAPTVRMIRFTPLATPGLARGRVSITSAPMAARGEREADAQQPHPHERDRGIVVGEGEQQEGRCARRQPDPQRDGVPDARCRASPRPGRQTTIATALRQQEQAGLGRATRHSRRSAPGRTPASGRRTPSARSPPAPWPSSSRPSPGLAGVRRSTSGSGTRALDPDPDPQQQDGRGRTARHVGSENHPHASPLVIASSSDTSAPENTPAPRKSGRPRRRTGDSGTTRGSAPRRPAPARRPSRNSHCQLRLSSDEAAADEPDPAAHPERARHQPDRHPDLLARELVADDPEAQREDGRARALHDAAEHQPGQDHASAAASEPSRRPPGEITSIRFLPYMSPSFPSSGVSTELDRAGSP